MDIITLLLLSASLAMDAFAVCVSSGMVICHIRATPILKMAGSFGLFQGIMPLIGYTIARTFADKIQAIDHWLAFILLAFIGGKMLFEVWKERGQPQEHPKGDPCEWKNLFVMSIATSIDALAVGASLAVMPTTGVLGLPLGYLICCGVIALVTFLICIIGVIIGCRTGALLGRKAEIIGGIVLIGIGVKILLEHLGVLDRIGGWFAGLG
ncbi:MAG: manganese efflux pump MntP family protein [Acutalibacteraceae bacterium]